MTVAGAETAGFDEADEAQFFDAIDRWIERDLEPIVKEFDHADRYPAHVVEQMKELGLFGATIGREYGGLGLPAKTYAQLVMRISSVWMSITGIFNSHLMLALAIEKFGTPEQKNRWLPKLASGEIRGGLALTEPDAGTDLQGIRMTARRDGDALRDRRHEDLDHERHRGVVRRAAREDRPGREAAPQGHELVHRAEDGGLHGRQEARQARLQVHRLRGARLRELSRAGGVLDRRRGGQGFYQVTGGLELGRINVAARGVGIAEGALQLATQYAQTRKTFGKPICEHQAIQLKLGEMATRARAARLLTLDAAAAFDRGERCDLEAGMAKYFASEAALENSIESMRIHGAYGYSKEYDIERLYRDAPFTVIGEGTNEIQRMIIAKQWLKRNPLR